MPDTENPMTKLALSSRLSDAYHAVLHIVTTAQPALSRTEARVVLALCLDDLRNTARETGEPDVHTRPTVVPPAPAE